MTMPILEGLDGRMKMSKSLNNYIAINDNPEAMFGKIMSLSDELMWRYYQLLSQCPAATISQYQQEIHKGANPRDYKVALAKEIVERFHSKLAAERAAKDFNDRFQRRILPEQIDTVELYSQAPLPLIVLLRDAGLTTSSSESRRMLAQGAVKIDGEKVANKDLKITLGASHVYQLGKRKVLRVKLLAD